MNRITQITLIILAIVCVGAFILLGIGFASDDGTKSFLTEEEQRIQQTENAQ